MWSLTATRSSLVEKVIKDARNKQSMARNKQSMARNKQSMARNKQSMAVKVLPIQNEIFGMFYEDWTIKFWQWLCSIPDTRENRNPVMDKKGDRAKVAQFGQPIFNLVPSDGSPRVERTLTLREGQHILIPVNVVEVSFAEYPVRSETDLHRIARWEFEGKGGCVPTQFLEVNGEDLSDKVYRVPSRVFDVYFPDNPIFGRPGHSKAVSDGYWAIIEPLPSGPDNTVMIGAKLESGDKLFYTDFVKYNITVE